MAVVTPLLARGLLGGHVRRRPHDRAAGGQFAVARQKLGQPEVADVRLAALVEQDVGRLQVAVQDAPLVRVVHRLGHGRDHPHGGPGIGGEVRQPLGEARAGDQLHREVAPLLVPPDLEDRHDVRVVEPRHGLGLVLEPPEIVLGGQQAGLEHLQGDGSVEADLARLVDDPHAAPAEHAAQLVVAERAHPILQRAGSGLGVAIGSAGVVGLRVGRRPVGATIAVIPARLTGHGRCGPGMGSGHRGSSPERSGQPPHLVVLAEERREFAGELGVLLPQRGAIERLSPILGDEKGGDQLVEPLFPVGRPRAIRVRHGWLTPVGRPARSAIRSDHA